MFGTFRRVTFIAFLGIALLVMTDRDVGAQSFNGGGWFGFSELTGVIDLRGVPKPDAKPTIIVVDASLNQIEILCRNPQSFVVAPGSASLRFVLSNPITNQLIAKNGQATVVVVFDLGDAENSINCNNNWTVVEDSAAVTDMTVTMQVFRCTGDPKTDPDPCAAGDGSTLTIEATPRDTFVQHCTLDPVLRNPDGTAQHDQVLSCVEI